jgi:serine protease
MHYSLPPRLRQTGAAVVAVIALWSAIGHGQFRQAPATRAMLQEAALPAIDRGLRDQDPPRAARTSHDADRLRVSSGAAGSYLSGSIIVKFKDDATRGGIAAATAQVAGTIANRESYANFDIVDIAPDADPEAAAAAMRARPDVEYAQPRYRNHAMARPNDTLYGNQWNFPAIDMERAWDIQPGASADIIVAVLDSGMAFRSGSVGYQALRPFRLTPNGPAYPALGNVTVPFAAAPELGASGSSRFVAPRDFIWNDDLPVDLDGHGTHVAGTVGQVTNNNTGTAGMAYNVRLMPVKVIQGLWDEIFGAPFDGTDDVVARGVRYAADNGANVINLSIGRETGGPATAVTDAIRYAVNRGCFVVVASGNTRAEGNQANRLGQAAPDIAGLVAVGAVGRTLDVAFYSTSAPYVELSAPGGDQRQGGTTAGILQQTLDLDVLETYTRPVSQFGPPRADSFAYEYFQGTSMAVPHVSGFAALLMQQGITNPAAIEAAMKQFATDRGAAGRDDFHGFGLINPRATLRGLGLAR